jgi:two-component system, NarL family, sensor histidine kinase DegS
MNSEGYKDLYWQFKKKLIRIFLFVAILPLVFYSILILNAIEISHSLVLVLLFIFVLLLFVKSSVYKNIQALQKFSSQMQEQVFELKQQYDLKNVAYQELEDLNFVVDNAALFASVKLDGTVLNMSKKLCDLLSLDPHEIRGSIESLLTVKEGQQQNIKNILASTRHKIWSGELELETSKGQIIWMQFTVIPMHTSPGKHSLFLIGNDVTEHKESQKEIDRIKQLEYEYKVQVQKDQASQIVEAQEEERKRIAKDIHDGIGQILTALKFSVESINIDNPEKAKLKLEDLKVVFGQLIKDVRAVTFSLTPPELSDHGIAPALKKMTEEISKLSGVNILFDNKTHFHARFDSLVETNLYRVAQEAVNNSLKYANSTYVLVSVSHTKDMASILIDDNGKGFDVDKVQDSEKGLGMGLFFMKERINYVNGRLFIHSEKGEGTRVTINIPVD